MSRVETERCPSHYVIFLGCLNQLQCVLVWVILPAIGCVIVSTCFIHTCMAVNRRAVTWSENLSSVVDIYHTCTVQHSGRWCSQSKHFTEGCLSCNLPFVKPITKWIELISNVSDHCSTYSCVCGHSLVPSWSADSLTKISNKLLDMWYRLRLIYLNSKTKLIWIWPLCIWQSPAPLSK